MRPSPPTLLQLLAATYRKDRNRNLEGRAAHRRARLQARADRASLPARLGATIERLVRRDGHPLTTCPCRLADGKIGRTAVVLRGTERMLVCRVA